jgi:SAM-dependent methyltransferase
MNFQDHFSGFAEEYRDFRPHYPQQIFAYLATLCSETELAWDCATGSGQAALELTRDFAAVIATDASVKQIEHARSAEGINYRVASAEDSGIDSHSVDLITVAQALHWFDLDAFAIEVRRVAKPNGILAVWTYNLLTISDGVDAVIKTLYEEILAPFWPPERDLVESGYAEVVLPFTELPPGEFVMGMSWDLQNVMGYLKTWSATRHFAAKHGYNPVDAIGTELESAWGVPARQAIVQWPIALKLWKINA